MGVGNIIKKIAPITFARQNVYLSSIALANISFLFICLYLSPQMPGRIPLWYGAASGEGQLAQSQLLILVPMASIVFLTINQIIILFKKDSYTSALLLGSSALFLLMCFISVIRISTLVGPW